MNFQNQTQELFDTSNVKVISFTTLLSALLRMTISKVIRSFWNSSTKFNHCQRNDALLGYAFKTCPENDHSRIKWSTKRQILLILVKPQQLVNPHRILVMGLCLGTIKLRRRFANDLRHRKKLVQKVVYTINQINQHQSKPPLSVARLLRLDDDLNFYLEELNKVTNHLEEIAEQLGPAWEYALANKIKKTTFTLPEKIDPQERKRNSSREARKPVPDSTN